VRREEDAKAAAAEEEEERNKRVAERIQRGRAEKAAEKEAKRQKRDAKEQEREAKKRAEEHQASQKAAHKAELDRLSGLLRRSRVWCNCGAEIQHDKKCMLRGVQGELQWFGRDVGVSREELQWYEKHGGRVKKGAWPTSPMPHGNMFPAPRPTVGNLIIIHFPTLRPTGPEAEISNQMGENIFQNRFVIFGMGLRVVCV